MLLHNTLVMDSLQGSGLNKKKKATLTVPAFSLSLSLLHWVFLMAPSPATIDGYMDSCEEKEIRGRTAEDLARGLLQSPDRYR